MLINELAGNLFHSLTEEKENHMAKGKHFFEIYSHSLSSFFKNESNGVYVTDRDLDGGVEIKLVRQAER